ncbi:ATP-binding protein [Paraburkholderia aspalathi]|uniref:Histidine kinase-, DNA gyrase B-, and HSP90-like ATPase n=1 Tax=Paraburkholderia aspalathi TaxID=1324617 RepID=A0A1I7A909_9BURK|nr:ATP-binding protein [Paraburkholderia aspalathi]SFT71439.1 hypothetical protein SAMN05192563_1003185 [Paraburkholderia aspalathi]
MSTICLKTNQHRLIANLRHAFNPQSMLGELLQNARRAGANHILVTADDSTITISDDGSGIADLQSLIFIAESGWDPSLQVREHAFGMGVLSTLYFAEHLSVHSGTQAFHASTAAIIRGDAIEVHAEGTRIGTEIRLDGVQSPDDGFSLSYWVRRKLEGLCEAFPVQVSFNGDAMARPLTDSTLPWRETPVGRILIDLDGSSRQWRCFLQGLPIGNQPAERRHHVVLLHDDMIARLPDRQHLLNEEDDHRRIQTSIDHAFRQALIDAKMGLAASEFALRYAETCLSSSNVDLLNDIGFVPRAWFRAWSIEPPGFRPYWRHYVEDGVVADEALAAGGVWCIEGSDGDELAAEVYVCARDGFLLEEHRLAQGHWLYGLLRSISPEQVVVQHGAVLHEDDRINLTDSVTAVLVESLSVGLAGESDNFPVTAVRKEDRLYLTDQANSVTRFVSDYVFDDRYSEESEDADARTLRTFIAIGCSQDPARVVSALLPPSLSYTPQAKLAGITVRLIFDNEGKLQTVTT